VSTRVSGGKTGNRVNTTCPFGCIPIWKDKTFGRFGFFMATPKAKKIFLKKETPSIRLKRKDKKDATTTIGPPPPPASPVDTFNRFASGYYTPTIPVLNNPLDFRPPSPQYIDFYCPYCGHYNRGRSDLAGSVINCSCCGNGISVPFQPTRPVPRIMASPPPMAPGFQPGAAPPNAEVPPASPPAPVDAPPPKAPDRSPALPVLNLVGVTRIKFYCVFCGQKLSAVPEMIGESSLCPSCSRVIKVPPPPVKDEDAG